MVTEWPDDDDLAAHHTYAAAHLVYLGRVADVRARLDDIDDALADLVVAHDRARWARWRALLAVARAERSAKMLARARDLVAEP